jgi:hypothetical protein
MNFAMVQPKLSFQYFLLFLALPKIQTRALVIHILALDAPISINEG